ncbi:MAG: hypothetical protein ACI39U_07230, partial [Candidatus Cryptobacteroides sp.]
LRDDESLIPCIPGVYIVVRKSSENPSFLQVGSGGRFKDRNPNVPVEELQANWVKGEPVIYIGMTKETLRKRIRTYLRFGNGEPVGHWGGRYIWQLADHEDLVFYWKPMSEGSPEEYESELIAEFKTLNAGYRPFANLKD